MSGDEDIEVVFNPKEDKFRLANAATRNDQNWIRLAILWDDELYFQVRKTLDSGSTADRKREACFEKVRSILDYEVPLVRMVDHSFKDAVLAFERINTLGVRLKKEDIESAHVASRHTGFIADEVAPFLARLIVPRIFGLPAASYLQTPLTIFYEIHYRSAALALAR